MPVAQVHNKLIGALSKAERSGLAGMLETVELARGEVLWEAGEATRFLIFPETCVVSSVQSFASGDNIETATVGCEGVVCPSIALGAARASSRHLVQIGGRAVRVAKPDFMRAFDEMQGLRRVVLGFAIGFMRTSLLQVACNRVHNVNQRLARWLLMTRDRSQDDTMPLTHDMLGEMLGVYRPTVTKALGDFRAAGLVVGRRGSVTLLDRAGLEAEACECYRLAECALPAGCDGD